GVIVRTGYAAREVKTSSAGKPSIDFGNGAPQEFDEVIVTLPSGLAAKLCTGLSETEVQRLNNEEYLGVIGLAVLLDKPISPFYITNITDTRFPFTGVIEMSALVDKKYLGGKSLVYLTKYGPWDDPVFNQPDDEIRSYFLDNFKKMYPWLTDDNIKFAGVAKAKHVITVAKLNYSEALPGIQKSMPGVSI